MVVCFAKGDQTSKPRISPTPEEFMPPSSKTAADRLAVAVVLTLELAKIARVLMRLDHVARCIVNADDSTT